MTDYEREYGPEAPDSNEFYYWQCKYCKERFDKQDESQSWQLHKIGHKLTEIEEVLRLIASAIRRET